MAAYYTYLISSLPALEFQAAPPFSFSEFLEICRPHIPERDFNLLKNCPFGPALSKWREFDAALRNELVKIRAARKKIDPAKYLRQEGFAGPGITHAAINASRNPSPLEAEKILDAARWRFLEELSGGHYFDLHSLIIYAHKLLLLERWKKINSAGHLEQLEKILQ